MHQASLFWSPGMLAWPQAEGFEVRDAAAYQRLPWWSAAPAVDFTRQMVIVMALGPVPSSDGRLIEILDFVEEADQIRVVSVVWASHPTGLTHDAVSYPAHALVVNRSDKPIRYLPSATLPLTCRPGALMDAYR